MGDTIQNTKETDKDDKNVQERMKTVNIGMSNFTAESIFSKILQLIIQLM